LAAETPVYGIKDFETDANSFYANRLSSHVRKHVFTRLPHSHEFYLVVLVTRGTGWHEIDFRKYRVKRGRLFTMRPGQVHNWNFSKDIEGFVFFHSKIFYDEAYTLARVQEFPFFNNTGGRSAFVLKETQLVHLEKIMNEIYFEHRSGKRYHFQRLHSLISIAYIDLARIYPASPLSRDKKYQGQFQKFQQLLEKHFIKHKQPAFYAQGLNITGKHLNRIIQACVAATTTDVIAERVVLEAKRLLMRAELNVNEISDLLEFSEPSYFVRFFKKHAGKTPLRFLKGYEKKGT
jgi:AraC family transcriptional activator of pobA